MKSQTIFLITLCTFLTTLAPTFWVQLPVKVLNIPILAQANITQKRVIAADLPSQFQEAEQLRRQGDAQLKRQEFQAALQSYQQSIQILRELKLEDDKLEEALLYSKNLPFNGR